MTALPPSVNPSGASFQAWAIVTSNPDVLWAWVSIGRQGPPWVLKFSAKKGCSFEWEKNKFHHFWSPRKILKKSPSGPSGKNSSDAHACRSTFSKA